MKKIVLLAFMVVSLLLSGTAIAGNLLYVDSIGACGGNSPCHLHPQDAVNVAIPGDTIKVYPGTYGHRQFTLPVPPHWGPGDQYAPALIVWKDNLTIEAVDPDPAKTTIETTYDFWVNKALPGGGGGGSIEHSTGCTWNAGTKVWDGTCVRPMFGTAPNSVAIIASNVTIRGFTFHRDVATPSGGYNAAGVMIGGLYAGYGGAGESLGFNNNIIENCEFSDVWHAVYIWHSSGNQIVDNTVQELGNTGHWAAISSYDGYNDAQIALGNLSTNNLIANNTLADKGIALGAWAPPTWTSNAGSEVCSNATTQVGVSYSHGPVLIGCNTGTFWQSNTDKVLRITGIAYTGDKGIVIPYGTAVNLSAQLSYDGSGDGSGVPVQFIVGIYTYGADTTSGGTAAIEPKPILPVGVYQVTAKVTLCGNTCTFQDTAYDYIIVYDPTAGFVTGGGWIDSPAGAYTADPTLAGKATFGFVSKYQKGVTAPKGQTEFQFKVADLNFKSTSYDWLVVAGAKAQFKGSGTINGAGDYGFMLTAIDVQIAGGGGVDKFRIKIWDKATDTIIYDNKYGAPDTGNDATDLAGGSIVIHK